MLKLTHRPTIDERARMQNSGSSADPNTAAHAARRGASAALAALNYWQLRAFGESRHITGAEFSEQIRCSRTLKADWKFSGRDAMKRLRPVGSCSISMA
jgi:hypothetical protein